MSPFQRIDALALDNVVGGHLAARSNPAAGKAATQAGSPALGPGQTQSGVSISFRSKKPCCI